MALVLLKSIKKELFARESRGCSQNMIIQQPQEVIFGGKRGQKRINHVIPNKRPAGSVQKITPMSLNHMMREGVMSLRRRRKKILFYFKFSILYYKKRNLLNCEQTIIGTYTMKYKVLSDKCGPNSQNSDLIFRHYVRINQG